MAKPTTFGKKENEKKKQARRQAKQNRKVWGTERNVY